MHAPNSPGVRPVLCCDRVAHGKGGTLAPGGVAWGPVRPEAWCGGEEQTRGGRRGSEEAEERAERRGVSSHAMRKKQARGVNWAQGRRPAGSTVRDGKQRRR